MNFFRIYFIAYLLYILIERPVSNLMKLYVNNFGNGFKRKVNWGVNDINDSKTNGHYKANSDDNDEINYKENGH